MIFFENFVFQYSRKSFLLFFSILIACFDSVGQTLYRAKNTYNGNSTDLIYAVKREGQKYIEPLPKNHSEIKELLQFSVDWHVEQINNELFIRDAELESYLNTIVDRIVEINQVERPFKVFIGKNPSINAFCTPIGSLIINNGLLARLNSEEELTFVLSHEIAHWELEHIKKQIINHLNAEGRKEANKQVRKLSTGKVSIQAIRNIKKFMQGISAFSRETELEADSMAYVMYSKLNYPPDAATQTLEMLDSGYLYQPYYGSKLFKKLDFEKFPFNTKWVTDESNREFRMPAASNVGSLSTHPQIPIRIERLESLKNTESGSYTKIDKAAYSKFKMDASYEDVNCAYNIDFYLDQALYYALRIKMQYPNNAYNNGMIGKILLKVSDLKENGLFLIRNDLPKSNKELYYVNTLLTNISDYESLDIAFYFMNQKGNFDRRVEEHYKILYDICGATNRFKMQEMVRDRYRAGFENGKYLTQMF